MYVCMFELASCLAILFLWFLLSLSFDREDISNTQDSVKSHFQKPRRSTNLLCYAWYGQLSYLVFEMWLTTAFRLV